MYRIFSSVQASRMNSALDSGVLRRQTEGVPTHRMEHVEAAHAFVARHHIADGIIAHMAHVNAPGGIGKHLEHVILGLGGVFGDVERLLLGPDVVAIFLRSI